MLRCAGLAAVQNALAGFTEGFAAVQKAALAVQKALAGFAEGLAAVQKAALQIAERARLGDGEGGRIQVAIWQEWVHARDQVGAANISRGASAWCIDDGRRGEGSDGARG